MSPRIVQWLSTVLGLAVLAVLGYGLFVFIREALRVFSLLDKLVEAAFIAAMATVLASAITIVLSNIYASRAQVNREIRDKKIPIYEALLKFTFRFLMATKTDKPMTEREVATFMESFNQSFMVWSSDSVLSAYIKWRRYFTNQAAVEANPNEGVFLFEDILFAIRRDLGHKNAGLSPGDVLALFINDVDAALPRRKLSIINSRRISS